MLRGFYKVSSTILPTLPSLLDPNTVVSDVEGVHDVVWLSRVENTPHS